MSEIIPRYIHEHAADLEELSMSREKQTAHLLFLAENATAFSLTIPLRQVGSLYRYIGEQLTKDPTLFAPE
jgi:hypothetical protein